MRQHMDFLKAYFRPTRERYPGKSWGIVGIHHNMECIGREREVQRRKPCSFNRKWQKVILKLESRWNVHQWYCLYGIRVIRRLSKSDMGSLVGFVRKWEEDTWHLSMIECSWKIPRGQGSIWEARLEAREELKDGPNTNKDQNSQNHFLEKYPDKSCLMRNRQFRMMTRPQLKVRF